MLTTASSVTPSTNASSTSNSSSSNANNTSSSSTDLSAVNINGNSNTNDSNLPQTPRSLAKSHDDGDVKYFFQRPEQQQQLMAKWSGGGDDSLLLEHVRSLSPFSSNSKKLIFNNFLFIFLTRARKCGEEEVEETTPATVATSGQMYSVCQVRKIFQGIIIFI